MPHPKSIYTTPAQAAAFAEAYWDRVDFIHGTAPEMHIQEPGLRRHVPRALPKPSAKLGYLDLGGKWDLFE